MPLTLPDRSAVFIDANIFYYHFVASPPLSDPCSELLERVADGRVTGYTSAHLLAEAVHKVMIAEAAAKFQLNRPGLVNWLQHHRQRITELTDFRQAAAEFARMGVQLLSVDGTTIQEGSNLSAQMGLLTNDALLLALMLRHGITHLATNDDDFDHVPRITVWKPR